MDKVITLALSEPIITMNGETVEEITMDFSKVKARDLSLVCRLEKRLSGDDGFDLSTVSKAASATFRMAFGWVAALRGTPKLTLDDIDKLDMPDILAIGDRAVPFCLKMRK